MRLSILLLASAVAAAQPGAPVYFSVPPPDAPELAARGRYAVGVRTLELVNPGQVDILKFDPATGKAPLYDRKLKVEIWYPAVIPAGQEERTTYESGMTVAGKRFQIDGKALRDAAPVKGETFPLVIVSHGYPGSRTFLSYLSENLASKGYVAASIDHTDSVLGEVKPFQSTLLNRAADQLFTIEELQKRSHAANDFLNGVLDESKTAIVGYSMGGYGAVASAGAGYSSKSPLTKFVPGGYLEAWTAANPEFRGRVPKSLKAVVAIAPWGAQPPYNAWDAQAFAAIRAPSLFIVGDQDDVSEYAPGVKRIFDGALNTERCMLVYENARHNVGGNPLPPGLPLDFTGREFFEEPAWRKDRMTAINQHFVTAFLDLYLKGDTSRRAYLHVTPVRSNDGVWPVKEGESTGGKFSDGGDAAHPYWKGFQRRFAVGLEMHCADAGQAAKYDK